MRPALALLTALALGAALPGAGATTFPTLTLTQQARKADVIVRATPGTPSNVTENGATWLVYPLTVTETIAGDPASLPQREGRPALYVLAGLEDLPTLRAGQEAFLLLYSRRLDSPFVGFSQGLYPIENGRVTRPGTAATTPGPGPTPPAAATPAAGSTPSASAPGAPGSGTVTPPAGSPPAPGAAGATPPPGPTTPTSAPGAGTTTPPTTVAPLPSATPPPGTATPAPAPANDPGAVEGDPARFRDLLRAAREGR